MTSLHHVSQQVEEYAEVRQVSARDVVVAATTDHECVVLADSREGRRSRAQVMGHHMSCGQTTPSDETRQLVGRHRIVVASRLKEEDFRIRHHFNR